MPTGHRGVAVQHLDVVGRDAEHVGHDLRPGRLVALAVRRGARDHVDGAGRQARDRRRVPAAGRVADRAEDRATARGRTSRCSVEKPTPSCFTSPRSRRAAARRGARRVGELQQTVERGVVVAESIVRPTMRSPRERRE